MACFRSYKRTRLIYDILALLSLFFISSWVAHDYLSKAPEGQFYQKYFAPAVMQACGKGYVNPTEVNDALNQFLSTQDQSFDCAKLPLITHSNGLENFQIGQHYLQSSVALIWKLSSINWKNVWYLNILLFCLTILGAYCVFRLGMNVILAFLFSLCLVYSTLHLSFLPHLRDYSVAPFALWFIWLLGLLVTREYSFKKSLILVSVIGVILGLSFGFRSDLLVCLPVVFITILFFLSNKKLKLKEKCILSLTFLVAFLLVTGPIFFQLFGTGSNLAHVTILGLFEPFSLGLGLQNNDATYSQGYLYQDEYVALLLKEYSQRVLHQPLVVFGKQYDHAGVLFLIDWLKNFPADFFIRVVGSVNKLAFSPLGFFNEHPISIYHFSLNSILFFCAPIAVLIILAFYSIRLSLFFLCLIIYLAGYSVMQFDKRHFFYLEFINIWCLGFTIQMIWLCLSKFKIWNRNNFKTVIHKYQVVFPLITIVLIGMISLQAVRWYQSNHLKELFTFYLNAKTIDIATRDFSENGKTIIKLLDENDTPKDKYLKITFSPLCSKKILKFALKFSGLILPQHSSVFFVDNYKKGALFYPIYQSSKTFEGIEIAPTDRACIKNIVIVANDENIKLWPVLWLPDFWENKELYQHLPSSKQLSRLNNNPAFQLIDFKTSDMTIEKKAIPLSNIYNAEKNTINGLVPLERGWMLLAQFPSKRFTKDSISESIFYVEGVVKQGKIAIGLINNQTHSWGNHFVIEKGKFRVYLQASKLEENIPTIGSALGSEGWISATIYKMGWVTL